LRTPHGRPRPPACLPGAGANPLVKDNNGKTPLELASTSESQKMLEAAAAKVKA
jgi:hypothetical protein